MSLVNLTPLEKPCISCLNTSFISLVSHFGSGTAAFVNPIAFRQILHTSRYDKLVITLKSYLKVTIKTVFIKKPYKNIRGCARKTKMK